jgi:hypothetical protein
MADDQWLYLKRPAIPSQKSVVAVRFRDLNPDYSLDVNPLIIEEKKAIEGQIRNVLSTIIGSEDFEPTYGCDLPLELYEPISPLTGFLLESDVIVALGTWMGGVISVGANLTIVALEDEDGYTINIPYYIKSLQVNTSYSFDALR